MEVSLKAEEGRPCAGPEADSMQPASSSSHCAYCSNPPKYKCPGCGTRSCSLECVKSHKERTGCTGKRNITGFVALKDFTDSHLLSDYVFVEDALRHKDAAERTLANYGGHTYSLAPGLLRLRNQAQNRETKLLFMAHGMSRRASNTSYYDARRRCLFWRVEWVFPSADVRLSSPKVNEYDKLRHVLAKELEPQPGKSGTLHRLRAYARSGAESLRLFLLKEPGRANDPQYYELNGDAAFRSELAKRCIIEFPVIHVALSSEVGHFPLAEVAAKGDAGSEGGPVEDGASL